MGSAGAISIYAPEQWVKAEELVKYNTTLPISEIAAQTGINYQALYTKAKNHGWLTARDMNDIRKSGDRIARIVTDITGQITDIHEHTIAMVEALQNSYRIEIHRDDEGHLHYKNMMPNWPGKPDTDVWNTLTEEAKAGMIRTIEPSRLQDFLADLMAVLELKVKNITFVTKNLKGALPKMDIYELDMSRRAADTSVDILASPDSPKLLEEIKMQRLIAAGQESK
jgi:hypothetical protein